jgi:hypothetical protein
MAVYTVAGLANAIGHAVVRSFIETCGRRPLAPSLAGATSIIGTATPTTIALPIWNAFQRVSTYPALGVTGRSQNTSQANTSQKPRASAPLSGIDQMRAGLAPAPCQAVKELDEVEARAEGMSKLRQDL